MRDLTAPPEERPHYLAPDTYGKTEVPSGVLEKVAFVSEDGEYIPGLLWLPARRAAPAPAVIIVDDRGKQAVAESGLTESLLQAGYAVLAVDLRGRGETLGRIKPGLDTNFRLMANQVLFGRPLAGRRAFDLTRILDYLSLRKELSPGDVTVVGLGDGGCPHFSRPRLTRVSTVLQWQDTSTALSHKCGRQYGRICHVCGTPPSV